MRFNALGRGLAVDEGGKSAKDVGLDLEKVVSMDPDSQLLA